MNDTPAANPAEPRAATAFSFLTARRRDLSPSNRKAWQGGLFCVLFCVVAMLVHQIFGGASFLGIWLTALAATAGWVAAVRFLLLDTAGRRFWIVWLVLSLVALLWLGSGDVGQAIAVLMSFTFLLFRRYQPYRHLTSRQRAVLFFLGFLALLAISVGWDFGEGSELTGAASTGHRVASCALISLRLFWVFSLVYMFFHMRLHFMRLKPKIFVSWVFIAAVPMVLLFVFAVITVYGSLGSTRARGVHSLLQEWVIWADNRPDPDGPFRTTFVYPPGRAAETAGTLPSWFPHLQQVLAAPPAVTGAEMSVTDAEPTPVESEQRDVVISFGGKRESEAPAYWTPADTAGFFSVGPELWLLSLQGVGTDDLRVTGRRIDHQFLDNLSRLAGCDVGLLSDRDVASDAEEGWSGPHDVVSDSTSTTASLQGRFRPSAAQADSTASFWERPLAFGGAVFEVIRLGRESFFTEDMLLHLQVPPLDLGREFVVGKQTLNQIFLIVLAVIAGMFLLIEIGALFFALRITSGITSAVGFLHRGTRRLARGDLDTRIQIPNEDEFGDLATSFNEMAAAVKKGREEAVARERLERELETAREIQERLLPHEQPSVPGFEITGTSLPSRQVGGDYYDFLARDDGRFGVAIGDVSGKGIPAALLMSNLQASLQGQVIHPSSVSEVVARVNDLLVRSTDPHMFATFFYGVLDSQAGTFTVTNAGHNPPIVYRATGELEWLKSGGIPLGWLPDQEYAQETVELAPGDAVVLFTDGITEAVGPPSSGGNDAASPAAPAAVVEAGVNKGAVDEDDIDEDEIDTDEDEDPDNMFGDEALVEVIKNNAHLHAAGIKDAILTAVAAHTAGTPQSDDITLVVIKRLGRPAEEEQLDY